MSRDHLLTRKVHKDYTGEGAIVFEDGLRLQCTFDAVQDVTGSLFMQCELISPEASKVFLGNVFLDKSIIFFEGVTSQGNLLAEVVRIMGHFSQLSQEDGINVQLVLRCGKWTITKTRSNPMVPVVLCFHLVNFTVAHGPFPIQIDSFHFVFRPVEQYKQRIRGLKATRGIDITYTLLVEATYQDINRIVSIVDDLCLLLTLARGCKITWISYEVEDQDSVSIMSYHLDAITKPFGRLVLIDPRLPKDTGNFLQKCYLALQEEKERWQLRKAIQGFTDGKAEGDFLESRASKLVVVVEHLKGKYLDNYGDMYILPDKQFEAKLDELKKDVRKMLEQTFPDVSSEKLEMMANHVQGMNWFPFRRAIKHMCENLGLHINSQERSHFVNIRNELVHRMSFHEKLGLPKEQYFFIMTFVGKLLLAILQYEGYFYDWTRLPDDRSVFPSEIRVKLELNSSNDFQEEK